MEEKAFSCEQTQCKPTCPAPLLARPDSPSLSPEETTPGQEPGSIHYPTAENVNLHITRTSAANRHYRPVVFPDCTDTGVLRSITAGYTRLGY